MSVQPEKLKSGDEVRIIAPSDSFRKNITSEMRENAEGLLKSLGLQVSYGKYVHDMDEFYTASVDKRLADLHEAIADKNVKAIIAVSGGTTSNQLLNRLDFNLIKENPKIICGHSDLTNIQLACWRKLIMISYYGPHFAAIGASKADDYTMMYLKKALFEDNPFEINASDQFYPSAWKDDEYENDGFWILNEGFAEGTLIGGNLLTINLLQGSNYFPINEACLLFIEDNHNVTAEGFFNHLQSLINSTFWGNVKGLLIGRFQPESRMTREILNDSLKRRRLEIPIVANVDFGHSLPMATLPIGGKAAISADRNDPKIRVNIDY